LRLFSFGGCGLALAAMVLVVFGAYDSYPNLGILPEWFFVTTSMFTLAEPTLFWGNLQEARLVSKDSPVKQQAVTAQQWIFREGRTLIDFILKNRLWFTSSQFSSGCYR